MKKLAFISLTLAILLLGCDKCIDNTSQVIDLDNSSMATDDIYKADIIQTNTSLDYSWFTMPEATDTLVIYSADLLTVAMRSAIEIFERQYPEVSVEWHKLSADEFEMQVRAEIPAGKGPDLLYADNTTVSDIYKTMASGVFEDLNPYAVMDDEFNMEDYITGIIDEGLLRDQRFIMPISHRPVIMATSEECLAETGLTLDDFSTYQGFIDSCTRFREIHPDSLFFVCAGSYNTNSFNLYKVLEYSGLRPIDYNNNTVEIEEDIFRKMLDLCRCYADKNPNRKDPDEGDYVLYKAVLTRTCLFTGWAHSTIQFKHVISGLKKGGETAVFFTPPDIYDGKSTSVHTFGAIPKGAKNKLNAWRLLKIFLSDEIQGNPEIIQSGNPVRRSAVSLNLNYEYYEGYYIPDLSDIEESLLHFDRAYLRAPAIAQFIQNNMMPYITGKKTFDDCYKKLLNTLELYKDE